MEKAAEHEITRPGLFWLGFLWVMEVLGVLIGAGSSFSVTFGDSPPDRFLDWVVAAPMVALATIELMRIYLARAFCYHRDILLRVFVALGLVLCVGVAFENWTIGIERMVDRRFSHIEDKRESVRQLQQKIDNRTQENARREQNRLRRQDEAAEAVKRNTTRQEQIDAALKAKGEEHARLMLVIRDGCLKIAGPCLVPKQSAEQGRYEREARPLREEQEALAAEVRALQREGREAAVRQFDDGQAAIRDLQAALAGAERELAREANGNVLNRLVGAAYATAPEKLSDEQFQRGRMVFSMFSAMALSISITIGALAYYWPRHLQRPPSRLSRALRAWIARRRKAVVRTVTETVDRIVETEKPVPAIVIEKPILRTREVRTFVRYTGEGPTPADVVTESHQAGEPFERVIEDPALVPSVDDSKRHLALVGGDQS